MLKRLTNKIKGRYNNFLEKKLRNICYKSRRLSTLYYFMFNPSFGREHQAVLSGKVKHIKESTTSKGNYFLLVRNIHRIEKGLLMRPRRPVFGKEYITETIDNFEQLWDSNLIQTNSQMKWFYDVLTEYFSSASSDPIIALQHKRFINKVKLGSIATCDVNSLSIPYKRLEENRSNITYEAFYKLTKQRRSVRWFLNKPVERELIDKAIMAANQSPSACNRQPFEFHIFDQPDLVKEVVDYPMGTKGYGHTIPVMIVLVGNLDAYFDERDRHIIYIDGSLASMSLMLALETLGLSSCSINWPDMEGREIKMEKFLNLEKHQRPIMCLGIGYPDPEGLIAFSEKRPIDQIRIYNNNR